MEIYEFGVIGTGPSAYASIRALRSQGFQKKILVIDGTSNFSSNKLAKKNKLKRNSLGEQVYHFWPNLKSHKKLVLPSSSIHGGFTRVWGGVFSPSSYFPELRTVLVDEKWKGSKSKFLFSKSYNAKNIKVNGLKLALDASACVKCGKCIDGCPYEAIWNASVSIKSQQNLKVIKCGLIEKLSFVQEIDVKGFSFKDTDNKIFLVKNLVIATGVVSSGLIALNSFSDIDKILLDQSSLRIALIWRNIRNNVDEKISLAQNSFTMPVSNDSTYYCQVYSNLKVLKKTLDQRTFFIRVIPQFIWNFLTNFIHICFIYYPPSCSQQILIQKISGNYQNSFIGKPVKKINWLFELKTFFKLLNELKVISVYLLPFWKVTKHGYSFHISGSHTNNIPSTSQFIFADGLTFKNDAAENFTSRLMDSTFNNVVSWYNKWHRF